MNLAAMQPNRILSWFNFILITIGVTYFSAKKYKYYYLRYTWQLINLLFILYIVVTEAMFSFIHRDNLVLLTVVFTTELTCFMDLIKMFTQMVYRDELKDMVDALIYKEYALKIPFVAYIMQKEELGPKAQELKKLIVDSKAELLKMVEICLKVYCLCAYSTITSMISLPILLEIIYPEEHYRELPFCMLFPWDTKTTPNYQITYLININAGLFCVSAYVALDSMFAFLLGHIIRQLRIICFILTNVDELMAEHVGDGSEQWERDCTTVLANCADHFISLQRFCKRLNHINKVFFVIQAVCSSILICMCLFKIAFAKNKFALEISQYYFYVMLATIQIGIYCWVGQLLINESSRLHNCLMSGWWRHGRQYRSNMKILQAALHAPLIMHIWGSIEVSHATFGTVVRTSVSYLALLKSVIEKK